MLPGAAKRLAPAVALFLAGTGASFAETIFTDFNLQEFGSSVFNDRIGNSRFFSGANTDRIRISTFVLPSPDSDRFDVQSGGIDYRSTNGVATTVAVTHSTLPAPRTMTFVGASSGLGGSLHEYTTTFERTAVAPLLGAWDTTPFTLVASNAQAPGAKSISYAAADYDSSAMPAFVTDMSLTGSGLQPRLDWVLPAGGSTPTSITLQVRRIDGETPDRSTITAATLVHNVTLDASATSYTFDAPFSNAGIPGFPAGLEVGQRYELAVMVDTRDGAQLTGRARTFFEFTPLPDGTGGVSVYLPSVGPDGVFRFDIEVRSGQRYAIDPTVAVGYDYQIGAGDPLFASVMLPDIGDGLYELHLFDGENFFLQDIIAAGDEYFFGGTGVDRFRILGIETSAGLDPSDPTAFATTVSFVGDGRFTGTMTPIIQAVPAPHPLGLLVAGLLALRLTRSRATAQT